MKKLTVFFIFVFALAANHLAFAQGKVIKSTSKALEAGSKAAAQQLPKVKVPVAPLPTIKVPAAMSPAQAVHMAVKAQQASLSAREVPQVPVSTSRLAWLGNSIKKLMGKKQTINLPPQALKPEFSFPTADFSNLKTDLKTLPPVTPWQKNPQDMFRAVSLPADGAALRNILENGFLLKDVGKFSNNRAMAYVSGDPRMVRQVSNIRFNSVAADPNAALHYAKQHHEKDIIVIARIQGLPEHGDIEHIQRDIPAENIVEVIAALSIKDTTIWCRVQAEPNGFLLTPYIFVSPRP